MEARRGPIRAYRRGDSQPLIDVGPLDDRGGDFAAMEEPELLVGDIREIFRQLR